MTTCVQPEWIMPSTIRLTRKALAAFQRWREATTDLTRRNWEKACELHQGEVAALRILSANLAACGPTSGWLKLPGSLASKSKPRPGLLEQLLHGLRLDEDALPDFLRLAHFVAPIHARWFEEGLREFLGMPEPEKNRPQPAERTSLTADCARLSAVDEKTMPWAREAVEKRQQRKEVEMTTAAAATVTEPAGPRLTPTERTLNAALEKRGLSARDRLEGVRLRSQIAAELGVKVTSLQTLLTSLRRKLEIPPPARAIATEPPEVQSSPPLLAELDAGPGRLVFTATPLPAADGMEGVMAPSGPERCPHGHPKAGCGECWAPATAADGANVPANEPETGLSGPARDGGASEAQDWPALLAEMRCERDVAQSQLAATAVESSAEREVACRMKARLDEAEMLQREAAERAQEEVNRLRDEVSRLSALLAETNERCVALETRVTGGQLPALADDDRQVALRLACGDMAGTPPLTLELIPLGHRAAIYALVVDILGAALR